MQQEPALIAIYHRLFSGLRISSLRPLVYCRRKDIKQETCKEIFGWNIQKDVHKMTRWF